MPRLHNEAAAADMIIRDARDADLPVIIDIYNATVPTRMVTAELEPTTVEARLPWFHEHAPDQYPFWVADSDSRVIGWLDFKKFLPRCACVVTRDERHGWPDLRAQRTEPEIIRSDRL